MQNKTNLAIRYWTFPGEEGGALTGIEDFESDLSETLECMSNDSYLGYWGLFFTFQEEQCKVYDVRAKKIISADLQGLDFSSI